MSAPITPPPLPAELLIPALRCFVLHEPGALSRLATLSPTMRATVCLVVSGSSRTEIAGARDVSRQMVHKDLHTAVERLGIGARVPCAACLMAAVEAMAKEGEPAVEPLTHSNATAVCEMLDRAVKQHGRTVTAREVANIETPAWSVMRVADELARLVQRGIVRRHRGPNCTTYSVHAPTA